MEDSPTELCDTLQHPSRGDDIDTEVGPIRFEKHSTVTIHIASGSDKLYDALVAQLKAIKSDDECWWQSTDVVIEKVDGRGTNVAKIRGQSSDLTCMYGSCNKIFASAEEADEHFDECHAINCAACGACCRDVDSCMPL